MLSHPQRRVIILVTIAAGLLIAVCARWGTRPLPIPSVPAYPVRFEGSAASEFARVLAEEYPDRVTGTSASRRAAAYLALQLEKMGYQVDRPTFSMWLQGKRVQGENVIAFLPGESPESVAIIAHYDGQFTSHQAAEDNASGVGVLLELASVLREGPHRRGLILAATDAEEWGMIGARELVNFLRLRRAVAVISIDYLTAGPATALQMACMGQFSGYTPLWLRQLVIASGRAQNIEIEQATGTWEWIGRALEISPEDQGPLLRAGIPALNLETLTPDNEAVRARYHTTADVFHDLRPATFQMMGAAVEQTVRTLDGFADFAPGSARPRVAEPNAAPPGPYPYLIGNGGDFQTSSQSYLPAGLVLTMQIVFLLPVLIAAIFAARNLIGSGSDGRAWRVIEPVSWILPPGLAVLLLYALTAMNLLPRYELYPATPKDPFLYHLPPAILGALTLVIVAGSVGLHKLCARLAVTPAPFDGKKRILFLWVACVALTGFFLNPYAMCLFLGGLAYAAGALSRPAGVLRRCANAILLILAAAPFAALVYSFGQEIYLGWRIGWYLILQAAYGVWSPLAVVVFLFASVLWLQSLRISVLEKSPGSSTIPAR